MGRCGPRAKWATDRHILISWGVIWALVSKRNRNGSWWRNTRFSSSSCHGAGSNGGSTESEHSIQINSSHSFNFLVSNFNVSPYLPFFEIRHVFQWHIDAFVFGCNVP